MKVHGIAEMVYISSEKLWGGKLSLPFSKKVLQEKRIKLNFAKQKVGINVLTLDFSVILKSICTFIIFSIFLGYLLCHFHYLCFLVYFDCFPEGLFWEKGDASNLFDIVQIHFITYIFVMLEYCGRCLFVCYS